MATKENLVTMADGKMVDFSQYKQETITVVEVPNPHVRVFQHGQYELMEPTGGGAIGIYTFSQEDKKPPRGSTITTQGLNMRDRLLGIDQIVESVTLQPYQTAVSLKLESKWETFEPKVLDVIKDELLLGNAKIDHIQYTG